MKKVFLLAFLLPLIIVSCRKDPDPPLAEFTIEVTGDPEVGKELFFKNTSLNAVSYEWDFGDGYISNDESPYYTYNSSGTFTVTLTAIGEDGDEDQAEFTIDILVPTLLVIEVRDLNAVDYVITGASVLLYESFQDLVNDDPLNPENHILEGFSDDNGVVVFSNLGPYNYYVDVLGGDFNNWNLSEDDIRTPSIMEHSINWFIAWVEEDTGKKNTSSVMKRSVSENTGRKIVSIEKRAAGTEGWEELYKRSVKK